jgi:[CysO sulfur-carrier protein]-S-L-cysteine hydrolase
LRLPSRMTFRYNRSHKEPGVVALRVTRDQLEKIIIQAQAEAPNECCGMLAGRGEVVEAVFPGRNKDRSPTTYFMDPVDQLRAFRQMDERGWDLIGIYHSHPKTEAAPSRTDRARALDQDGQPLFPNTQYVIVSLRDHSHPQVRAFRLAGDEFTEEDVVIS